MVQFPWQTSSQVRQLLPNNYAGNVQPQNQPKGWWYSPSFFPLEFQEQNPKERSLQPAPSAAPSFWKHLPASMMMHRTVLLPKKWPALRCPPLPPAPQRSLTPVSGRGAVNCIFPAQHQWLCQDLSCRCLGASANMYFSLKASASSSPICSSPQWCVGRFWSSIRMPCRQTDRTDPRQNVRTCQQRSE